MSSMRPKQRDKDGETFSKSLRLRFTRTCSSRSSECICKSRIDERGFFLFLSQKEQESVCLIPILYRKSFVAIIL